MASACSSSPTSSSAESNILWEHGDDCSDFATLSPQSDNDSPLTSPPLSSQPTTHGLTSPLATMSLASQSSTFLSEVFTTPVAKTKIGRPRKKPKFFHGNQYSVTTPSQANSSLKPTPRKRHQPIFKLPKRGYSSKFTVPRSIRRDNVEFKSSGSSTYKPARIPTGMRLLDVEILAQAMTKLKCPQCSWYLSLWESETNHGWQTMFSIKCSRCHELFAEFPSSKPTKSPVNLPTSTYNIRLGQ